MIRIKECSVAHGAFRLDIPSITFTKGHTVIIGPSGSGKSTLLAVAAGLRSMPGDTVQRFVNGRWVRIENSYAQKGVLLMGQENALWNHLNVRQHLLFALSKGNPYAMDPRVERFLKSFSLSHRADVRPPFLSWGERRRLALARALAASPEYLFLDEPFANVDMVQAVTLNETLISMADENGIALIQVTHYPFVPKNYAKIVLVENGRVISSENIETITKISPWAKQWMEMI